jgi:hypothetical protein
MCWLGHTVFVEWEQASKRIDLTINQDGTFLARYSNTPWPRDPSRIRAAPLWPELFPTSHELRGVCSRGDLWPTESTRPGTIDQILDDRNYLKKDTGNFLLQDDDDYCIAVAHDDTIYTDGLIRIENVSRIPHKDCPRDPGDNTARCRKEQFNDLDIPLEQPQ